MSGSVSPAGNCTTLGAPLFGFRTLGEGLIATVFCGVTGVAAAAGAGMVMGVVRMAWLVPGMSWNCPPCCITWIVWGPWICGTTWYWMLAGVEALERPGLWMVTTMGLLGLLEPRPAWSWITLPFADRKPRFLGGAGAIGAGLIGRRRRG